MTFQITIQLTAEVSGTDPSCLTAHQRAEVARRKIDSALNDSNVLNTLNERGITVRRIDVGRAKEQR